MIAGKFHGPANIGTELNIKLGLTPLPWGKIEENCPPNIEFETQLFEFDVEKTG